MLRQRNSCWNAILASSLLLLCCGGGGCGNGNATSEALPTDDVARQALEASLTVWREGGKPGPLAGTQPPVQVLDTPWSLGDRLSSYEILAEDKKPTEMRFSVRLSLAKPERVQEVQYYVLGRDPVMVFRDEDYIRNINMDNGPSLIKPENAARRRRR
jgi:hypothetical protein